MRAHGATGQIAVYVNRDDAALVAYERDCPGQGCLVLTLPAGTVGSAEALRWAVGEDFPDEPWYGLISDDNLPETAGFEAALVSAAGTWGIASANDGWQSNADPEISRMQSATVFGGDLIRSVGYLAPEGFKHLYIDDVWEVIGRELGNWRILMDVVVRHDHPIKDGRPMDATHALVNSSPVAEHDCARFMAWRANEAPAGIHRARMAMWAAHGWSLDLARSRSVLLGFPVYERPCPQHEAAAMDTACLLAQLGIKCGHVHVIGRPIHQARNGIANAFLESGFTDLFMIDADMSWSAWDVVKFLAVPHPLIAAVGRKRNERADDDPDAWCFSPIPELGGQMPVDQYGMCEVEQVGTGFMRIHRSVLEHMQDAHPEWSRRKDRDGEKYYTRFFAWTDDGEDEISEDIGFCRAWRTMGGQVFIDPSITLRHFGPQEFRGCVSTILTR
jgi:hypothetical protein